MKKRAGSLDRDERRTVSDCGNDEFKDQSGGIAGASAWLLYE